MASTLTIRNVPEKDQRALKKRAENNGRSVEAELRAIIADTVKKEPRGKSGLAPLGKSKLSPEAEAALARLQRAFAAKPGEQQYSVDDFLRDRRADWGEE